jgi:putative transposase
MIKVKSENDLIKVISRNEQKPLTWHISNGFSSFFQSDTRAVNTAYNRTGPLFESPFRRIEVDDDAYFTSLIVYIHKNPQKHGMLDHFQDDKYSSYSLLLSENDAPDAKYEVLSWYGGKDQFIRSHEDNSLVQLNKDLTLEE